jgi:hypothetical protein
MGPSSKSIERPEVPTAPVDVDEINDRSRDNPVHQVACRPADDERQTDPRDPLMMRQARGVHPHADERRGGDQGDHDRLERELRGVQDPERRPGVPDVGEIHEPGDDRHALVKWQTESDHRFGQLVERHDPEGQPDLEAPPYGRLELDLFRFFLVFPMFPRGTLCEGLGCGVAHAA